LGRVWDGWGENMIIGGLQKTTLIDFPGKVACTVFLAGCNFRCPWCYSRELVLPAEIVKQPRISEKEFFDFLQERKELLEGVVICGGEPTINKELLHFIKKIKSLKYAVKLDTNGSNPAILEELIKQKLIDYIAMDIKVCPTNLTAVKNIRQNTEDIKKSAEMLRRGAVDFEFRTTVVPGIHSKADFLEIAKWIGGKNVKYYLQNFRPEKTIFPEFEKIKPYKKDWLENVVKQISPYFKECKLRDFS
jgi:pyruvate formate lyase activating enzyme